MKLRTDNIHKIYKGRQVVDGVSIEVNQGEIVGLLGPNGAGKTTSFYMIVGLISPNQGHVYLDDHDITYEPMYRRAQLGIGYLPQEVSVFRKMTVEDNVMAVLEMTKLSKEERHARLEKLLDEFGLQHVRKNLGQSLSGGEKRRTEIARALATDPKFILLDEPFAGVDPIAVEDIQRIVWKLKSKNIGVLITDHNVQETLSITDRTYLLFEGSILRSGSAEELASDPTVRKVYLGQNFELRRTDFNISVEEREARENENRTPAQKNAAYVSSVQNLAKRCLSKINSYSFSSWKHDLANDSGYTALCNTLTELRSYFSKLNAGKRTMAILSKMEIDQSDKRINSKITGVYILDKIISLIPVINLTLLLPQRNKIRYCRRMLTETIKLMEALKQISENPEMEEM